MDIGQRRGYLSLKQRAAKQKTMFFCPVMRANGMEKNMMLAQGEGRRKRGRLRKRWMEERHTMSGMNLAELMDAAEDWDFGRKLITSIAMTHRDVSPR